MKTNYKARIFLSLFLYLFCLTPFYSQIRLVRVDPSNENVTIKNFGGSSVDISDYKLCIFPAYPQLSSLSIVSGSLNLGANQEVTVVSSANLVDAGGELGLYIDTFDFSNSSNIVDYVQWISSGNTRENVAVGASIWGAGTTIPNTVSPPYQYNGNGSTDNGFSFWGSTLSSEGFSQALFSMYPNPAQTELNLDLSANVGNAKIKVYSTLGKEIFNTEVSSNRSVVNVSNWLPGIYLVRLSSLEKTHVKRFIKL